MTAFDSPSPAPKNTDKHARLVWRATGETVQATLGSGYEVALSGAAGDDAASPMELLLASVAGCTALDVIHMLRKQRQQIETIAVEITGQRATDHPKVYTDVAINYIVTGEGISPSRVERAIALSMDTYCSASATFRRAGVEISTSYEIAAPDPTGS